MRKLFALLLVLALLPVVPARAAKDEITVYNWGQYISDGTDGSLDVIAAFEEATGIHVNYLTYDSNESLYTKLKTGGASYDVIIPSDYMIGRLIEEDMLEPLNFDNIPNYQYVDEAFRNTAYDPDNRYSVPYTWGTVGVIYNSKYVDEADAGSWDLLWNSKYAGKILMFDNNRDAFAIAESLLGYSLNTTDEASLRQCAQKLVEQKPILQGHVMDQIYAKMEREEAWIAPYYAGDYLYMVEEIPPWNFTSPKRASISLSTPCAFPRALPTRKAPRPLSTSSARRRSAGRTWSIWATPLPSRRPRTIWIRNWPKIPSPTPATRFWQRVRASAPSPPRPASSWTACG